MKPTEHFNAFLGKIVKGESYIHKIKPNEEGIKIESKDVVELYKSFSKNSQDNKKDLKFDEVRTKIDEKYRHILNHAVFLWGLPNNRKPQLVLNSDAKGERSDEYIEMPGESVAGGGSGYVQTKVKGIRFILYILSQIWGKREKGVDDPVDGSKKAIIGICNCNYPEDKDFPYYIPSQDTTEDIKNKKETLPDGAKNLLMHLCYPEQYEPIASTADKEKIKNFFYEDIKQDTEEENTLDSKICGIKKRHPIVSKIVEKHKANNDFSFYGDSLPLLWKGENNNSTLSIAQLLEYKKAMVLYGPPGTGKTYTSMELAKQLLIRYNFLKFQDKKIKAEEIFDETEKLYKSNIDYLQFHVNYTYDNFIAGQAIEGNTLVTKEGFIFDVINKANKAIAESISNSKDAIANFININEELKSILCNEKSTGEKDEYIKGIIESLNKKDSVIEDDVIEKIKEFANNNKELQKAINAAPFIVILDEMNRVDVSRVFGELFTAIEKRGIDVKLTLSDNNGERLKLNIPFNIHFIGTMNEIDFSLEQLDFALRRRFIWQFSDYNEDALEEIIRNKMDNINTFLENCTALNKKIGEKLSAEYHIGHAFFAEIAEIYNELKISGTTGDLHKQAQNILWQISIKPTIDAYCGTMEPSQKKSFVEECRKVFVG